MGKRLALLVGVSDYGEGLEPLPGSLLDVEAMAAVLQDSERGAFEVQSSTNCDRGVLEEKVGQLFGGKNPDDVLLLYFSGHGDLGSGGMLHQQLHLCTRNTHKQQGRLVEWSAVSAGFLKRQMDLSKSQKIVVILDCCYSGAIADLLKKGEGDIDLGELKAKGRVILASSSAAKVALQAIDGLSLYTRYLIEGMEGAAYPGQGAWILAQDLHRYADRRFEIESKGGYSPKIIAEDTGFSLPIVKAPKPDAKLDYQQAVDRIFQELDQDLEFNGEIEDDLDRGSLDTRRHRLKLSLEDAKIIEAQVQKPYLVRAEQRRTYADYFQKAVKAGCLPTERARRRLAEIRQNLLLGEADASQIEQLLTQRLNLKPVPSIAQAQATEAVSPTQINTPSRYAKLEAHLKAQEWKEADKETYRLMITTVGKEEGQWFDSEELLNFPCEELKAIDGLWVKHSQGRFGFSVQKKIYVECGATLDGEYPGDKIWKEFGDRVGWKKKDKWLNYSDLSPSLSSPQGNLPFGLGVLGGVGFHCVGGVPGRVVSLFSRTQTCEL